MRIPAYHPDNAESRRDWARYYDIVTAADEIAGEKLAALDEAGLADETIVFYYGDHGSGMSRSKRWTYNSLFPLIKFMADTRSNLRAQQMMNNFAEKALDS